jgi:hypothetical protein
MCLVYRPVTSYAACLMSCTVSFRLSRFRRSSQIVVLTHILFHLTARRIIRLSPGDSCSGTIRPRRGRLGGARGVGTSSVGDGVSTHKDQRPMGADCGVPMGEFGRFATSPLAYIRSYSQRRTAPVRNPVSVLCWVSLSVHIHTHPSHPPPNTA